MASPRGGRVRVRVTLDDKDLTAGTGRVERSLSRMERSGSQSLHRLGRAAKVAGLATAAGLGYGLKESIKAAADAERVIKQTETVIKSTGGAANVTAREVHELAMAIRRKSGMDDEAVQAGANMLLTFAQIRNEAGKGNDIFNQTTLAAADMSSAFEAAGKSMSIADASLQLGKALNSPAEGFTRLKRVGVDFTKSEQERIKTLDEAGKRLEAQKVLLAALERQFGGSAKAAGETFAGQMGKAKHSLGDLADQVGRRVTPALGGLAEGMADLIREMETGTGTGGRIASVVGRIAGAVGDAAGAVAGLVRGFQQGDAKAVILVGTLASLAAGFAAFKVLGVVIASYKGLIAAQIALNLAMRANPLGVVITVLAGVAAGLVVAYKKSETFRDVVRGAFSTVRQVAGTMFDVITFGIRQFLVGIGKIMGVAAKLPLVGGKFKGIQGAALAAAAEIKGVSDWIKGIPSEKRTRISVGVDLSPTLRSLLDGSTRGAPIRRTPPVPLGRASGGMVPGTGRGDRVPAILEPGEFVVRRRVVERFGPTFFAGLNGGWGDGSPGFAAGGLVSRANRLDGMRKPYKWGGGHGDGGRNGFDCSGAVSWVLGVPPRVSGGFMNYGRPGPGRPNDTKLYANPKHIFMVIHGRGFGTSRENPGGGPGWISYNHRSGFVIRNLGDADAPHGGGGRGEEGGGRPARGRERGQPAERDESRGSPSQRALEAGLADADLALARAEGTATPADDIKALQSKQQVMRRRLRTINTALKSRTLTRPTRVRLVSEKAQLLRDIRGAGQQVGELRPGRPTPGEMAELGVAAASLTPDLGDDYAAAATLFGVRERELQDARKSGNVQKVTEAIGNLKAAGDALKAAAEAIRESWTGWFDTALGQLDAAMVKARVDTPGDLSDDLAVLNAQLGVSTEAYRQAVAAGDDPNIIKFGNMVLSLRDAMDDMNKAMNANTQTTEQLLAATRDLLELERQAKLDAQRAYNVSQSQYGALEGALVELVGRGQGRRVGLAIQAAGSPGRHSGVG